jgi:hypothetical protein
MSPDELRKECEACRERIADRFATIDRRLTTLEITVWGPGGSNGIKGTLGDLRKKMDMLLRFFWIATAIPAIVVSLVALLKFLGKL